ncbi:hypothetical protein, partial [Mesorhizobium sp. M2E.F.Ca.ET.154.01.1.1]|uniref:hypothetical protein n=1 Tax=Mesorhizobium sp. M2E.F.Ca.ET.154.01.1.1 TaxID=2500521 RepID=UPI001AEED123
GLCSTAFEMPGPLARSARAFLLGADLAHPHARTFHHPEHLGAGHHDMWPWCGWNSPYASSRLLTKLSFWNCST